MLFSELVFSGRAIFIVKQSIWYLSLWEQSHLSPEGFQKNREAEAIRSGTWGFLVIVLVVAYIGVSHEPGVTTWIWG